MFWIQHELNFPELIDFSPLHFKTWEKKWKEKQLNLKIFNVFGTPYVRHLGRDLKNQILTILKTNSEYLILKFSGSTFVLVNKPKKVPYQSSNFFFKTVRPVSSWKKGEDIIQEGCHTSLFVLHTVFTIMTIFMRFQHGF